MIQSAVLTSIVILGVSARAPVPDDKRPETITNSIGMKLASIPAGEFLMGSPESEVRAREFDAKVRINEKQHRVRITKPFYLGVYDVTRGQFAKFVTDTNYKTEAERDGQGAFGFDAKGKVARKPEYTWRNPGLFGNQQTDEHPVVDVSWNDAQEFCKWLSKKEGKTYRLPTGAEWEYACRAGTTTPFHFGDKLNGDNANCNGSNDPYGTAKKGPYLKRTTPVGSYKPNAFGLYDMHGNVQQWCADWISVEYYENSPVDDPQGPPNPDPFRKSRMTCGGGWNSYAVYCRSAARDDSPPAHFDVFTGFRVVLAR